MKRLYVIGLFSICMSVAATAQISTKTKPSTKPPKRDRIDMAMEQESLMTMDPSTGRVSKRPLLAAKKYLNETTANRSATFSWEERGPNNVAGRTRAIIYDLNDPSGETVFAAGVSGGLWKTRNIKSTNPNWQAVDDFFGSLAICAITQNAQNPSEMYFGTGEGYFGVNSNPGVGIWKSTNGGNTWNYLNSTNSINFDFVQNIIVDDQGAVYVCTQAGLFKSTNGGSSWNRILGRNASANSDNINDIVLDGSTIYVSIGLDDQDGIYKSTDRGSSWTKLTNGLPTQNYARIEMDIAASNTSVLYALFEKESDASCLGIYKTTNGGSSWTSVENPPAYGMANFARSQAWYNLSVAVDPSDPEHVIIGGIDLLKSTNGGSSWTQLSTWVENGPHPTVHSDQHVLLFNPSNSNDLIVGNDGGVWLSTNTGQTQTTFSEKNNGLNITQFYNAAMHPDAGSDYFLAGAQDNGSHKFTASGVNNTTEVTTGDGVSCYIDADNPQMQITSYIHNNYFVSTDGGNSFDYVELNNYGFFANPNFYDSVKNILYASSSEGNILRWKDPQNKTPSFQHIIVTALNGQKVSFLKESPNHSDRLYIGTSEGDVMYIDGASSGIFKSATILKNGNNGFVSSIDIENGDEDHIVMCYSNYGIQSIFESTNGGSSWLNIEGNLPDMPIRDIMMNPESPYELIAATELGVWKSDEDRTNGVNWDPENVGMANVRVDDLVYRVADGVLAAATHGRGLFTTTLQSENIVPVDIIYFDVDYLKEEKQIQLEWQVANEINVDYYLVQKSFDGEEWDDLEELEATNTPSVQTLNYYDSDLYIDNYSYYYRIKVVDYDGSEKYSELRSVYLEELNFISEPVIYPNPFQYEIFLENIEDFQRVIISDASGKMVMSFDELTDGLINLADLQDGIYYLSWIAFNGDQGVLKMIKQNR